MIEFVFVNFSIAILVLLAFSHKSRGEITIELRNEIGKNWKCLNEKKKTEK